MDTENVIVKKQVLELLSALCVYNAEGYTRSLEVLEQYKTKHSERYRFSVILKELKNAQTNEYKAALIAFINCLIISTTNLHDRIRIRNEFVGLKLISVLSDIRREKAIDNDVLVQLDVFDEQRDSDESQFSGPEGVDLSSPLDVFHAVFRQVADTPQEMTFLNILQHLLRIDMRENISDMIWDTAETMIHKVTLLDSVEERQKLIRSTSYGNIPNKFVPKYKGGETRCLCGCHRDEMGRRKSSLTNNAASPGLLSPRETSPLPQQRSPGHSPLPAGCGSTPAPPSGVPPMPLHKIPPLSSPEIKIKLPQQNIPKPKAKMKTFNWNKLPDSKVVNGRNVWTLAAENHKEAAKDLDWSEMEGLFCQQSALPQNVRFDPNAPPRTPDAERKKKEQEIMLLDGKRSLNINIILKQFRSSNDQILHLIKTGAHDEIGAERLRGLLKILPTNDEVEALKSFDGDHNRLGSAEKFLLQLIAVPSYRLRIDAMLLKEEFSANVTYLEPAINAMIVAGEELKEDQRLRELLYMVVLAGNFLNSGGYAGNAAGVKLASLQKLTDIRANKPGMNLIHYVALQAEKKDKALLEVADNLPALEEATKATTDQLKNDVAALDLKVTRITKQLESQPTGSDIKEQMDEFLKLAETQVNELKEDLKMLDQIRSELAEFFCEEKETFKLEECFKVFFNFLSKLKHAVLDNQKRLQQEAIAQARRKQREELLARRRQSHGFSGSVSGSESDAMDVDDFGNRSLRLKRTVLDLNGTLSDREPSFLNVLESPRLKRRQGSFSGPNQETSEDKMQVDEFSATGSLRRRRSRVPSEEDDSNLLEYLRASGHGDGTRERLSVGSLSETYGSLDRSWARRLRGGKRRPDLLSADLTGESVPKVQKEAEEITEKPPDQKVEAWLLNNVQQRSKASDIRKRFWKHRKSLDIESDKIQEEPANAVHLTALSPLPEVTTPRTDPAISGLTSQKPPTSSNWKPNINTKDVSNAMEVIEEYVLNVRRSLTISTKVDLSLINNKAMEELISIVNKLQDICTNHGTKLSLDLPQIAVIGGQSAGKSSVLESFVRRDFLPRGTGIVTRRPLILQLINSHEEYAEFGHLKGNRFIDFDLVRLEIEADTERICGSNKGISDKPIRLQIHSPYVLNLTLIDLPGMTKIPVADQPQDIENQIRDMLLEYISKENCLILAVSPANADLATSDALKLAQEVDATGVRTIGVITKLDLMDEGTDARNILENKVHPLQRGYIGVVNRSQKNTNDKKSIQDAIKDEKKFFLSHPAYTHLANRMGTPYLHRVLNKQLTRHIKSCLPALREHIQLQASALEKEVENFKRFETTDKMNDVVHMVHFLRKDFERMVEGGTSGDVPTDELSSGAKINNIFHQCLPEWINRIHQHGEYNEKKLRDEIACVIKNINGVRASIFIPDRAFGAIVNNQIPRLMEPSWKCVDDVIQELKRAVLKCTAKMCRFPILKETCERAILTHISKQESVCKDYIQAIIDCELAYHNTNHDDFVGFGYVKKQIIQEGSISISQEGLVKGGNKEYSSILTTEDLSWYKGDNGDDQEPKYTIPLEGIKLKELESGLMTKKHTFTLYQSNGRNIYKDSKKLYVTFKDQDSYDAWKAAFARVDVTSGDTENDKESMKNKREILTIRNAVDSYMKIVSNQVKDLVPKCIVKFLLNSCKYFIQSDLLAELYLNNNNLANLVLENEEEVNQREEKRRLYGAYAAKKSPLRKQAPKAVDMDKRKAVIASLGKQSDFQDSLTVYVRGKSVEREETVKDLDMSVKSGHESQPKLDISVRSGHAKSSPILIKVTDTSEKPRVPISSSPPKQKIDKIDIDSENIETPPVTRRSFSSVRPLLSLQSTYASDEDDDMMSLRRNKKWSGEENKNKWKDSDLGEGKFDRYSSIRRSRRIRKAPEGAPSSDEEPAFERKEPDGVDSELEKVESNDRVEDKLESTPTSETKKSKRSFRWSLVEKSDVEKAIAQIDDAVDGTKMKDDSWKSRLTRSFRHSTDKDKPSVKQVERAKENVPPTKDMGLRRLSSASIVSKKENTTGLRRTVSSASTNEKPKSLFRSKKEPAESKPLRFGSLVRTLTGVKESQKKDIKPVSPVKPVSTTTRTVFALPKMQSRDSLYEAPKAAAATTTKSKTNARPPTKVTIGQAPQLRSLNRTNRRSDIVPSPTSSLSPTGSLRRSGSSLAPPRTPLLRSESVRVRTATRVDPSKPPVKLSQLKPATPIVPKLPARTSGGFSFMRPTASSSAKDGIHTTKAAPRRK
ncbi:hypothetical protein QYM36_006285 [Artemia franciscana]|uniref:dynamin GTPase n=1 Tax=Artemia franciscana TaxID=6661 RepID=A0AA88HX51_ARTSF|nr:hypothetical protein QYM36_006285 [Artemia franciscana]